MKTRLYFAYTEALREDVACRHYREKGFGAFYGKVRVTRVVRGKKVEKSRAMWDRYVAVEVRPDQTLPDPREIHAVSTYLHNSGGVPRVASLADRQQIEAMRADLDDDGFQRPREAPPCPFVKGDELELLEGPFASFPATFEGLDKRGDCRILVTVFGRLVETAVPLSWLRCAPERSRKHRGPRSVAKKRASG